MDNVVTLSSDRPRPRRALGVPRSGARILFFTGVRYCRDEAPFLSGPDPRVLRDQARAGDSGLAFDLAAH